MKKAIRPIRTEGNVAYVPLTRGFEAIVDACDVPLLAGYNWHAHVKWKPDGTIKSLYAHTNALGADGKRHCVKMHRAIAEPEAWQEVDHINGKGLDNRRENLRCCLRHENMANQKKRSDNTTGIRGVYFFPRKNKWSARIMSQGVQIHLGYFKDKESAALAYEDASLRLHGEFRRINA